MTTPSFGIKTAPVHVDYDELRRVWLDADEIPEIEHAWLYDHLMPRVGDPGCPAFEGWTLLTALAAQTRRLRLGILVSNNRMRHPTMLAKIAATVDVISGGRLDCGIGVGGLPESVLAAAGDAINVAAEFDAYGMPRGRWSDAVADLDEACSLIRRMWTEDVFDFDGRSHRLRGVRCSPKPVQRPHPPILIGGAGDATLRVAAEHATIWSALGPPVASIDRLAERSATLDELCAAAGRDPGRIVRSAELPLSREVYDDPRPAREHLARLAGAGFTHLVVLVPAPYPAGVARWIADELIGPTLDRV